MEVGDNIMLLVIEKSMISTVFMLIHVNSVIYVLAFFLPPGGGEDFFPNWKTGKNLKEDFMKKGREREEKKEQEKREKSKKRMESDMKNC